MRVQPLVGSTPLTYHQATNRRVMHQSAQHGAMLHSLPYQGIVLTLLPFLPSPHRCIKRSTSIWRGYDLFFLANLVIHSTDKLPTLPTWIDNLVTKINHLVQLLTNADDLPRSAHGWVFLRALRRYDGPAVPGNQDPQTNQIVHSHPFSLTSRNSAIDFTEKVLGGMAAYDRRKRLTLGEAIDHNNKASIVVALTSQLPKRILISIHQPVPRAHLNTVDPIPLAALPPFGVYYCHTTTFERILREGIRPGVHSSRATDPRHIAIKLQASREDTMSREVLTSPLNQRRFSVAIFVAIPSTARSGSQWFWVDIENNIVGTPTIPLESAHFHCALSLDNDRVVHHWLPTAWNTRPRPALSWTPLYTVLSRLSHAHPWTSLILDLKDLMPDLDRHYHHQLLVAMLQPNPPHLTPFIVVDQFLYCLAITITNILTPPNSQVDPPEIDSFFFHPTFWHRHLIHGTNLASPSFFDASLVDTLAGDC